MFPHDTPDPARTLIFAYGTLMRGECRHQYLDNQQFLGEALTLPKYRLVNCGTYPGLLDAPESGQSVYGEVWAVSAACKRVLDEVEGVDDKLYETRTVQLGSQFAASPVIAYFYLPDASALPVIDPDWRKFSST